MPEKKVEEPNMKKQISIGTCTQVMTIEDIGYQIPSLVQKAQEVLCRDTDDEAIAILRHFDWNQRKMEERWFDNIDALELKIGLRFDQELIKKHPDIMKSTKEQNEAMCGICFVEFD